MRLFQPGVGRLGERYADRRGSGRALYEALFERLEARGYRMAVAGMTLPNEASVGLHRAMGFEPVGVYRRIGWKLPSTPGSVGQARFRGL